MTGSPLKTAASRGMRGHHRAGSNTALIRVGRVRSESKILHGASIAQFLVPLALGDLVAQIGKRYLSTKSRDQSRLAVSVTLCMKSWRPAEEKGTRVHGDGVQPSDLTGCARFGRHTRAHVGDAEGASAEAAARDRFPGTRGSTRTLSKSHSLVGPTHFFFPELDYPVRKFTRPDTCASAGFRPHF
jgi:hypothetical protein